MSGRSLRTYRTKARNRLITFGNRVASAARSDVVPVGWKKCRNFGDQLTPDVFRHFGLVALNEPRFEFAAAIGVGSILQHVPEDFAGAILGAGLIFRECEPRFPLARIHLVRGRLTRERIGAPEDVLLGDPGILADRVYTKVLREPGTSHTIGIVPHYQHRNQGDLLQLASRLGADVKVIDVYNSPASVVKEIASCRYVVSSSLHGLVVADSLGLPNRWLRLSGELIGGEFKFHDYYSAYGIAQTPVTPAEISSVDALVAATSVRARDALNQLKSNVESSYRYFAESWK